MAGYLPSRIEEMGQCANVVVDNQVGIGGSAWNSSCCIVPLLSACHSGFSALSASRARLSALDVFRAIVAQPCSQRDPENPQL